MTHGKCQEKECGEKAGVVQSCPTVNGVPDLQLQE